MNKISYCLKYVKDINLKIFIAQPVGYDPHTGAPIYR